MHASTSLLPCSSLKMGSCSGCLNALISLHANISTIFLTQSFSPPLAISGDIYVGHSRGRILQTGMLPVEMSRKVSCNRNLAWMLAIPALNIPSWFGCNMTTSGLCVWMLGTQLVPVSKDCGTIGRWSLVGGSALLLDRTQGFCR